MIDLFANIFMGLWISAEKKSEIINFKIDKLSKKPTVKNLKKIDFFRCKY
ncbi:hypothetical protein [Spiroplasma culicicola]|uniref:Uncharacterized protein n=1 Tax=Spiroplasma culicicola AES-1 TaxID=1276246 RepID=W6A7U3_9MOLU|nr:hypothetical protein [Spiroplasma culicicola]AHI53061.1 hypothetical protein SCULI_v1c07200 [Spiroplasma culicicola AES-1]